MSTPISRDIGSVEVLQEATPEDTDTATPEESESGWIVTLATNYANYYDTLLNQTTASGALTTTTSMGVAHKSIALGTVVELYSPKTGLSCIATVNDRGPYDGRPDTFDFQMGVTAALGGNSGWYTVHYSIIS